MNKVENIRIRDLGGQCDGVLARLVVGRVRIRVEGDHMRREGKRGPILPCCSVRPGDGIYMVQSPTQENKYATNLVSRKGKRHKGM